jgi:hypothetical protein
MKPSVSKKNLEYLLEIIKPYSANKATVQNIYRKDSDNWVWIASVSRDTKHSLNDLADGVYSFAISNVLNSGESMKHLVTIQVVNGKFIVKPPKNKYDGNNSFETAANLGTITSPTIIECLKLKRYAGEVEAYFKFKFTATGDSDSYIRIESIDHKGIIVIQLFDVNRKPVTLTGTTNDCVQLNLDKLVTGTYYAKVTGCQNAVNSYALSINPPAVSIATPTKKSSQTKQETVTQCGQTTS